MKARHILLLVALALILGLVLAGQTAAKPGPLTTNQTVGQSWAPDLVQRCVERQPASAYYTAAALKAYGLRMQAMAAEVRAAVGEQHVQLRQLRRSRRALRSGRRARHRDLRGVPFVAVSRSRHPQVAL